MYIARSALAVVMVLGLTVIGAAGTDSVKMLVGKWEVTKSDSDAPPGATVEFTKDGKMHLLFKVKDKDLKVNGTYKVKDNTVTSTLTFNGKTKTESAKITKLSDTVLIIEDEKGKVDEYKRVK